jgi:hypothetical protein
MNVLCRHSRVWRIARLAGALFSIPLALWACTSHPLEKPDTFPDQQTDDYYAVNPIRDVDLLFVIDNSGSTQNKQTNFARNFPSFINALQAIPGGLPNVHIGVVTSDLGSGNAMTQSCRVGGDGGRFQVTDIVSGANCGLAAGANWMTNDNLAPGTTMPQVFSCMALRQSMGCGSEHQLKAADVALHPRPDWNPMNAGFLRPDAYLAIILLTDEDDCSAPDDAGAFFSGPPPTGISSNSRCAWAGHLCNGQPPPGMDFSVPLAQCMPNPNPPAGSLLPVLDIINDIKGLKPGHEEKIVVAAIAGWPAPGQEANARYAMVAQRGGGGVDLAQVCQAGGGGTPALRIKQFVDAFQHGLLQTICQDNYATALTQIGTLVGSVVGNNCISAPLVDANGSLPNVQADCVVTESINGGKGTPLPQCTNGGPRPCWQVKASGGCPASGFLMDVDRAGMMPPDGVSQSIKCRTCAKPGDIRCSGRM